MKRSLLTGSALLILSLTGSLPTFAEDAPQATTETTPAAATESPSKTDDHYAALQKKYELTDAQMTTLKNSNLPQPHLTKVAELAKESGKSIDEILKMRVEQKMGWGKIAKELGVHPGRLGRGVAEMNHEHRAEHKEERKKEQQERKENRMKERAERKHGK